MRWLSLFLLAVILAGCQFCDRHFITPGESQVIRTTSGNRYYFDLEENAAAGYRWTYGCDDSDVEVTVDRAPGKAAVAIRIHRGFDGPACVRFCYRRAGDPNPVRQFALSFFKRTGDVAFWE